MAARVGLITKYQPLYGFAGNQGDRPSQDRWDVIKPHLPKGRYSTLDVGSQFGFFTLSAAQAGGACIGVERVWQYRAVADALARQNKLSNAAFLHMELNAETAKGLPGTDLTICLSVYHHWVLDWKFAGADEILSTLCQKTQRLVFETGQSDETDQSFAQHMGFMGGDCKKWLEDYLRSKGFTKITHLGEFSTHLGPFKRHLYIAEKTK